MIYEKNIQIALVFHFVSFSFLWTFLVEDMSAQTALEKKKKRQFYLLLEKLFSLENIENVV